MNDEMNDLTSVSKAKESAPISARLGARRRGFTLIEMMVVIAILLLAFGIILPSLTEFLKNRELDAATAEVASALQTARMQAVVNGRPFHVVFFREGVRVFDLNLWNLEDFDEEKAPASEDGITFDLFFAGRRSAELMSYAEWSQKARRWAEENLKADPDSRPEIDTSGLITIAFQRDGTLKFLSSGGNDVPSGAFRKDAPTGADIVVWQLDNDYSGFVDLQPTGSVKSKVAPNSEAKPLEKKK